MSYGQCYWLAKRTWILHKGLSGGLDIIPTSNPMFILNMALPSKILTVAHIYQPLRQKIVASSREV